MSWRHQVDLRVSVAQLSAATCHGADIFHRHIVSNIGRVAARDSSRAIANGQDLFIALCEDSSIYGLFKNMTGG